MANRIYFRDSIVLTQALLSRLLETVAPGEELLLAARELRIAENLTIHDRELMVFADMFDGSGGTIVLTVPHRPATAGDGTGQAGLPGRAARVFCQRLHGIHIVSHGGNGQPGAAGKDGRPGKDFTPEDHSVSPPQQFQPATAGGNGGSGRPGGGGGAGGEIVLRYVQDLVPGGIGSIIATGSGGVGGAGGAGGAPGLGGAIDEDHTQSMPDGEPGQRGATGATGATTIAVPVATIPSEIFGIARLFMADGASSWARHRLKMGEYFFRRYIPNSPSSAFGKLARDEADAVIMLGSAHPEALQATTLRNLLLSNLTAAGVERSIEPLLSVPRYVDDFNAARARADVIVDRGLLFGLTSVTAANIRTLIEGHVRELKNPATRAALEHDAAAAAEEQTIAEQHLQSANGQIEKLSALIEQRKNELVEAGKPDLLKFLSGTVAPIAIAVGFTVITGGAGAALAALPLYAGMILNSSEVQKLAGTLVEDLPLQEFENAASTINTVASYGNNQPIPPNVILSVRKFRTELDEARGRVDNDPVLLDLLAQQLQAVQQHFLANLRVRQAGFGKAAADQRVSALDSNIQSWDTTLANFDESNASLRRYTVEMIERSRGPFDTVLRLQFMMARALELYTLTEPALSSALTSDYGYAHPDVEANFLEGADVGSLLEYLASIATLSSSLPGDQYALLYQSYTEPNAGAFKWTQPEYDVLFSAAPDEHPELFTRFKDSGRLDFHVDLANVSAKEYFEAKIRGVKLIFDGGQYGQVFNPVVQHWGRSAQQHRPGTGASRVEQDLFPTFELIPVATETGTSGVQHAVGELNRGEREPFGYWGRGLAATYSLEVKNLGQPGSPKLDTLTRLTIRFRVDTFATGLSAAQLAGVSLAAQALLPGATAFAALELAAPAPEGGAVVTGKSSHPGIVLRTVTVAAGASTARLPIEVAPHAAGATAVLLARSSATTRAIDVVVPNRPKRTLALLRPNDHQGMHVAVQGLEADERFVYAAYYLQNPDNVTPPVGNGVLAVIDQATWKVLHRVPVGIQPVSVAVHVNAQRRRLFVVNRGVPKVSLSVIDLALDGSQVRAVATVPLQAGVVEVAVHQASNRAYVTNGVGTLYVIDTAANPETADPASWLLEQIPLPTGVVGIAVNQAAHTLFLTRSVQQVSPVVEEILTVNPLTRAVNRLNLQLGPPRSQPRSIAFEPVARRLYVGMLGAAAGGGSPGARPNVTAIDLQSTVITPMYTHSGARMVALDARGQVYAASGGGVELLDPRQHAVGMQVVLGSKAPGSVVTHPSTSEIYVADLRDGSVSAVPSVDVTTSVEWR